MSLIGDLTDAVQKLLDDKSTTDLNSAQTEELKRVSAELSDVNKGIEEIITKIDQATTTAESVTEIVPAPEPPIPS